MSQHQQQNLSSAIRLQAELSKLKESLPLAPDSILTSSLIFAAARITNIETDIDVNNLISKFTKSFPPNRDYGNEEHLVGDILLQRSLEFLLIAAMQSTDANLQQGIIPAFYQFINSGLRTKPPEYQQSNQKRPDYIMYAEELSIGTLGKLPKLMAQLAFNSPDKFNYLDNLTNGFSDLRCEFFSSLFDLIAASKTDLDNLTIQLAPAAMLLDSTLSDELADLNTQYEKRKENEQDDLASYDDNEGSGRSWRSSDSDDRPEEWSDEEQDDPADPAALAMLVLNLRNQISQQQAVQGSLQVAKYYLETITKDQNMGYAEVGYLAGAITARNIKSNTASAEAHILSTPEIHDSYYHIGFMRALLHLGYRDAADIYFTHIDQHYQCPSKKQRTLFRNEHPIFMKFGSALLGVHLLDHPEQEQRERGSKLLAFSLNTHVEDEIDMNYEIFQEDILINLDLPGVAAYFSDYYETLLSGDPKQSQSTNYDQLVDTAVAFARLNKYPQFVEKVLAASDNDTKSYYAALGCFKIACHLKNTSNSFQWLERGIRLAFPDSGVSQGSGSTTRVDLKKFSLDQESSRDLYLFNQLCLTAAEIGYQFLPQILEHATKQGHSNIENTPFSFWQNIALLRTYDFLKRSGHESSVFSRHIKIVLS